MIKLLGNPHETSSDFDQFDTLFRAQDVYDHVNAAAAAAADAKVGGEDGGCRYDTNSNLPPI